jgi:Tol biopolymer transport system component
MLVWSLDGNLASFAYPDNQNGTPFKLWVFDPAADTWTSLWEYPYIDQPMWSPDGEWLAFRQQDGLGGEDIMAIRRDGSDPKNLTVGGDLPIDGRPYVLDGWINGSVLVHSAKSAGIGETYLVRVADGHIQSMFETSTAKAIFVPSHDGAWLAYDDFANSSMGHSIRVSDPDGANPVELASFASGSLFPIIWSPDNNKLAFVYYTEPTPGNQTADVYVINRNGTGLQQVFKGAIVSSILFSPDGKYLLINESSSATGSRLYVVNLSTLEQRLIESPGLTLDSDWVMPSWRK